MNEKRKAYYEKFDAQLDEWGVQIDHLKARTAAAKDEFIRDHEPALDALQRKHEEAMATMKDLKAAGDDAWDDLVAGLEKILADGKAAYHNAVSHFTKED
ncbi:MAG: hypothetical protein P4L36_07455 [Holophaga sp.]|nr:hypothetical protein [Holophaga sp.]